MIAGFDVCLTTDMNFAAPTAATARAVALRKSEGIRRVFYVWADQSSPPLELLDFLEKGGVTFVAMPKHLLAKLGSSSFMHITSAAIARFFLNEILHNFNVEWFLYLDADIELLAPLTPLLKLSLSKDEFAAVGQREGMLPSRKLENEIRWNKHLARIGVKPGDNYFNSGVIFANLSGWQKIGEEADDFLKRNQDICIYPDQDALNAVSGARRKHLSLRFNFQKSFFNLGIEKQIDPAIVHFCGTWKPWQATPLTRTWAARKVFVESMNELPLLWQVTWPNKQALSLKMIYHRDALLSEFRGRKKLQGRLPIIRDYFKKAEYLDGKLKIDVA